MNITFRKGKPDDAEICASICYEAFKGIAAQHNFPPDFADRETAVGLLTHLLSRTDTPLSLKMMVEWSAATSSGKTQSSPAWARLPSIRRFKISRSEND